MTESTQLQKTENNNTGVVKMEPPPTPSSISITSANVATASLSVNSSTVNTGLEQHQQLLQTSTQLHTQPQQSQQHQQQEQQHYALKWNDFQTSILSSFRHLRDEEDFVDVTLACFERSFTAHKVVLSACSPYFRKLLKANPCDHPIIILRDVRSEDIENLLSFMYNGEVSVSHEYLDEFLKTAHLLQVRGLADVNGGHPIGYSNENKLLSAAFSNYNNNKINICNNKMNNNNENKANCPPAVSNANNCLNNQNTNHTEYCNMSNSSFSSPAVTATAALALNASTNINASATAMPALSSSSTSYGAQPSSTSVNSAPAIQELKASSASPVRKHNNNKANSHWDFNDLEGNRKNHLTPPPQKRIKSADLFRAQHGISPERLLIERDFPVAGQHPLTRNRSRDTSKDRSERNLELRESLLGQALENSNGQQGVQKHELGQSAGEDSNSSDTEPSDRIDNQHDGTVDDMDNPRSHAFPNAFLGLQNLPGLLPGTSGMGSNEFVSRRSLEMRVRATDPRPCPKCGKIYRSAHTLRTHLEDKHTVCPGYRCVLCGTVAKSRNSLHSHMSRQHRGISTKDLPVLPMPSAFDPELASRLLAKAGVKISPAELRARASPTGGGSGSGNSQPKLDLSNTCGGALEDPEDSDDDPEDLTTGGGFYGSIGGTSSSDLNRYHESLLSNFGQHANTISRLRNEAAAAAAAAVTIGQQKDNPVGANASSGQSLLDTYLQFITENTFGIGMSQEHAAAAALHAAKIAQLNAIGHGLEKLPSLLPPQFDLGKLGGATQSSNFTSSSNNPGISIEPLLRHDHQSSIASLNENGPSSITHASNNQLADVDIRCDPSDPMDLGLEVSQPHNNNESPNSDEENYSEDGDVHKT